MGSQKYRHPGGKMFSARFLAVLQTHSGAPALNNTMKKIILASAFATAAAASIFVSSPVKAACLTTSAGNNCATFNGVGNSDVVYNAFTDGVFSTNAKITDISFDLVGITGAFPITLSNLKYSFDNFATAGTTFNSGSYTATGAGIGPDILGGIVNAPGGVIGTNFAVSFTIPAGTYTPTTGTRFLRINVGSNNAADTLPQTQTRSSTPVASPSTAQTPGPLPLVGAAAAFGFSRKLRRRISVAA